MSSLREPITFSPHTQLPVLFEPFQIAERVRALGAQIDRDLAGERVVLVGVLKGAAIFLSDLARAIRSECTFDFVAVSSYGQGASSSGAVKVIKDLDQPIEGKNIIFERRYAENHPDRLPELAAELVSLKVDVIMSPSAPQLPACRYLSRQYD